VIEALVLGKLYGQPSEKTTKAGKPFCSCRVRVPVADAESVLMGVVAFDAAAAHELLAMDEGDSVSLAGTLKVGTWTDRTGAVKPSLDLVASKVLTAYHVARKRKAVAPRPPSHGFDLDDGAPLDF
jgi:single-stranded DNA-binding protein